MSGTGVVFRKEMRDLMRDRRVRSAIFFGPLFLVLLLTSMFGLLETSLSSQTTKQVYALGPDNLFIHYLESQKIPVERVPDDATAQAWIRQGKAHLVLEFDPNFDALLKANHQATINGLFNPSEPTSQIASGQMGKTVEEFDTTRRDEMLKARGIDPASAEPAVFKAKGVLPEGGAGASQFLSQFLPYLVVIWAFYGGMSSSAELVAGEKEKNTLETLLISPVLRSEVAYGKFFALASVCLLSSVSCIVGLALAPILPLPGAQKVFEGGGGVSPIAAAVILAVMVPSAALYASIMMAVSAYARNIREASTQLSLLSFVVLMPALFSQFIGFTDYANADWVAYIPILDSANTIRHALGGKFQAPEIGITLGVNCIIAILAIWLAIHLFNQEKILGR